MKYRGAASSAYGFPVDPFGKIVTVGGPSDGDDFDRRDAG